METTSVTLPESMTEKKWNKFILENAGHWKDISTELAGGFLMYGQSWEGKILFKGKKYIVTGWWSTKSVSIKEVKDVIEGNK